METPWLGPCQPQAPDSPFLEFSKLFFTWLLPTLCYFLCLVSQPPPLPAPHHLHLLCLFFKVKSGLTSVGKISLERCRTPWQVSSNGVSREDENEACFRFEGAVAGFHSESHSRIHWLGLMKSPCPQDHQGLKETRHVCPRACPVLDHCLLRVQLSSKYFSLPA